jgi:hypothetical protein
MRVIIKIGTTPDLHDSLLAADQLVRLAAR